MLTAENLKTALANQEGKIRYNVASSHGLMGSKHLFLVAYLDNGRAPQWEVINQEGKRTYFKINEFEKVAEYYASCNYQNP